MTAEERLVAARDIVKAGWCSGVPARDKKGRGLPTWREPKAVCFCAGAAWEKAGGTYDELCLLLAEDVVDFNDAPGRTQEDVVAAFDQMIERERARAAT